MRTRLVEGGRSPPAGGVGEAEPAFANGSNIRTWVEPGFEPVCVRACVPDLKKSGGSRGRSPPAGGVGGELPPFANGSNTSRNTNI